MTLSMMPVIYISIIEIGGGGATVRAMGITPSGSHSIVWSPFAMLLALILGLMSFRPVVLRPGFCFARSKRWPSRILLRLCRGWSGYTQVMSESLMFFPRQWQVKTVSLVLVMLFLFQIPGTVWAGDVGVAPGPIGDETYVFFHHGDHLGSTQIITEGALDKAKHAGITYSRGDIIQKFEYSPFGQETYVLNPNLRDLPSYTGQKYDVSTGLYYYKSRYYNPKLGRFIQPDSVLPDETDLQSHNRYSYVSNNPLKYVDPSGHVEQFFGPGGIAVGPAGSVDPMGGGGSGGISSFSLQGLFNLGLNVFFQSMAIGATNYQQQVFESDEVVLETIVIEAKLPSHRRTKIGVLTKVLDVLHVGLDLLGFIPVVGNLFDLVNAGIYAAYGDYVNAGLSLLGAIPLAGLVVGVVGLTIKMSGRAIKTAKNARKLAKAKKTLSKWGRGTFLISRKVFLIILKSMARGGA